MWAASQKGSRNMNSADIQHDTGFKPKLHEDLGALGKGLRKQISPLVDHVTAASQCKQTTHSMSNSTNS